MHRTLSLFVLALALAVGLSGVAAEAGGGKAPHESREGNIDAVFDTASRQ